MPHAPVVRPYRWLAQYYDEVFTDFRTPIDRARQRVLGRILPHIQTACDLACGTGATALSLAQRGIKMYAVDLSPAMCQIVRSKARRAHVSLRVIHGDMRTFRLPQPVDLITCECDALNHLSQRSDLRRVSQAVERALNPGGYFYFDVNTAHGFETYWTDNVWVEKPGAVLVMRNGHSPRNARAWSDLEWFVHIGRAWTRHHERVEEVCWTDDEIRRAFNKPRFDQVLAWDAAPFFEHDSPVTAGCRTIYLVRKSQHP